ncbi:hypothetical protein E2C01_053994 [Portunus trituberculatus]|uniref:Uncharacterized protein n=1 Tax=Portunus trituberculatus TaxID=210409 RepID=A0A5B7GIP3_PORTR|nr:hypothetical protein [Portunus trituberculatus]
MLGSEINTIRNTTTQHTRGPHNTTQLSDNTKNMPFLGTHTTANTPNTSGSQMFVLFSNPTEAIG